MGFCGIMDVVLVLGLIIFLIIGYKKGFMKKAISIIGIVAILIFSIIYCGQFASFLIDKQIIAPSIYNNVYTNAMTGIAEKLNGEEPNIHNVLTIGLGLNGFLAGIIEKSIGNIDSTDGTYIASCVATGATKIAMIGIAFLILVIGISLICLITKIVATILRKNAVVHFVDGALGSLLYAAFYMLGVFAIFAIVSIFYNQEWFASARQWMDNDMGVRVNAEGAVEHYHFIKLTCYIFENNLLVNIFHLFF